MRRAPLALAILALVGIGFLARPQPSRAAPGQLQGTIPAAGGTVPVVWGGGSIDQLVAAAAARGCSATSVWAFIDGQAIGYVAGAPGFVNSAFTAQYPGHVPASTILVLLCSPALRAAIPTASATATPPPVSTPAPTAGPGLIFDDEFNGPTLDTSRWWVLNRGPDTSNRESECYLASNVSVSGGALVLHAMTDPAGCRNAGIGNYSYSSGAVISSTFSFTYGRVDVRMKVPGAAGTWPAAWLLGADCQITERTTSDNEPPCDWPNPGSAEIDYAEFPNANWTNVNQQVISAAISGAKCYPRVDGGATGWHTYSVDWEPSGVIFYIDGTQSCSLSASPDHPLFLILNDALGGKGGVVNDALLPADLLIDYIRVTPSAFTTFTP